jgi:septal ring factor EnvC (AmiA/AmiB activator)
MVVIELERKKAEAQTKAKEKALKVQKSKEATSSNTANKSKTGNNDAINKDAAVNGGSKASATVNKGRAYSPFESTQEGLTESVNFENSRGRLPWPVSSGIVTIHFGVYQIPGTPLKGNSEGITISLPTGTAVKSVADGEVSAVFDVGGQQAVVVRHGKYFTAYSNLNSVKVSKGSQVNAGSVLGTAGTGGNGDGEIVFMVNNSNGPVNPESWLRSR